MLESTAATTQTILNSTFVLTFIINLLLKGVMGQLWNVFNTLQILLALPLLNVILPANILFMQSIIDQVVNFKPIDKETLQELFLDPIFGSSENEDKGSPDLLVSSLLLLALFVLVGIIITVIVLCRRQNKIKCCSPCTKLVATVQAKLMFNALLRAFIQSYLLQSIKTWQTLFNTDFTIAKGIA